MLTILSLLLSHTNSLLASSTQARDLTAEAFPVDGGRIAVLHSHPAIVPLVRIKTARAVGDAQRKRPLGTAYRSRGQLCPTVPPCAQGRQY
ncbi:hypothetical protein BGX38DRAFT_694710 [Terfezia claveryi]|nr:hypothetical protein BGX38DRAFT_694710 [Terfezia claveryi]